MCARNHALIFCVAAAVAWGQDASPMQRIADRLDRLERENQALAGEVHALREELAALRGNTVDERTAVVEQRVEEHAQTKVEAAHKLPISITGMALFNGFLNRGPDALADYTLLNGPSRAGATWQQTVIGLRFNGPAIPGGGHIDGSLDMDFFGGSAVAFNHLMRVRVANLSLNWKSTSLSFGQDKPLIAPREPDSLAEVGVPPLTGAGNLWLWQPQARLEQRMRLGEEAGLKAQVALYQTDERAAYVPAAYAATLGAARPGVEGRIAVWRRWGEQGSVELGSGFHASETHVAGYVVPSRVFSLDGMLKPWSKIELSGTYYSGYNMAGLGALGQGFTIINDGGRVIPVHGRGGWMQLAIRPASRLTFDIFGGRHEDRASDLVYGGTPRNESYAANAMYRLGSNVMLSLEGGQVRTLLLPYAARTRTYYDLAIAYLF